MKKPNNTSETASMAESAQASCYRPITFDCGDGVTIRLCPELVQTRTYPEYWFIRRDLHSWDNVELWRAGFKTLYWSGVGWQHHAPKQFTTAQEAMDYHRATLSDNALTLAPVPAKKDHE